MATLTSGDTLSLNGLAGAAGVTQNSNVSLGARYNGIVQAGVNVSLSDYAIDSVGSISGYTYAVENTTETYTLTFGGAGSAFASSIFNKESNFTWGISPSFNSNPNSSGYITLAPGTDIGGYGSNSKDGTLNIKVGHMNPQQGSWETDVNQRDLASTVSHTLSVTFADGFNDHATDYNTEKTKTIYSVDTYDGNTTLCLTADSPVTLADGTIVEVGDLEEGDMLSGYSLEGLSDDEYTYDFYSWNTSSLETTAKDVEVVNVIYSFAERYYSINDGEVTATAEHPLLVKDSTDDEYRFKQISSIIVDDKLIKGDGTEVSVTTNSLVEGTVEIVSIDVEEQDTYLVNGYITHNKGGNTHSGDLGVPGKVSGVQFKAGSEGKIIEWSVPTSSGTTGITAYHLQIDNNSDFSSPTVSYDEWSSTEISIHGHSLASGTNYIRIRAIDHGLYGAYSDSFSFTV